jgi:hypothetical protein
VKKCFAVIAVLIAVLILCTGCQFGSDENRVIHAKIRYFDGSVDTLEIERWFDSRNTITLHTSEGRKVIIGVNNVILIDETEEQYNH